MTPPRRVAVTGGAGFIGSHVVAALVEAGTDVLVIDDLSHSCGAPLPEPVQLCAADEGSAEAARALVRFRPQALLHLAARWRRRGPAGRRRRPARRPAPPQRRWPP